MFRGGERRSWMLFVDGENFTIRGQDYAQEAGIVLTEGPLYRRDRFLWIPNHSPTESFNHISSYLSSVGLRGYYYTSLQGDAVALESVRDELWKLRFTPQVFKKNRQQDKAKGVDIALTKDMLSHAFRDHYEVACLIAGDGDYVPLVEEVKREGKLVVCMFFEKYGLSPALKLACDEFYELRHYFKARWDAYKP